jgi:hypothetical protein
LALCEIKQQATRSRKQRLFGGFIQPSHINPLPIQLAALARHVGKILRSIPNAVGGFL